MYTDLINFLIQAKSRGYAAGGESTSSRESDKSKSTRYSHGFFSFHDNWFGGEPFGGREVVWKNNNPIWIMVYYGSDSGKAPNLIPFLLKALSQMPHDMPVRGPKELREGGFIYKNIWKGTIDTFSGEEKIFYKDTEVFSTKYSGGLVDQRKDQM
jgi:hypothetical protein